MGGAALLALVGPSSEDLDRVEDLLASAACYEPELGACVLIDDAAEDRAAVLERRAAGRLPVTVLRHPRRGRPGPTAGALTAGVLTGLAWLHARHDVDFVLKIDLDALIIAPFQQRISALLRARPDAGVVGCVGETCDRSAARHQTCLQRPSPFAVALELMARFGPDRFAGLTAGAMRVEHPVFGPFDVDAVQYEAVLRLRSRLARAAAHGQTTADYCQGGAYAVSAELIRRMAAAGMLDDAMDWLPVGFFGEDEILSMYCFAAGLRLYDFSNAHEPFGIAWSGLPFEPTELLRRDHALIHSLKQDVRHDEADIRRFFAARRARHS